MSQEVKATLWRYARVFLVAFIGAFSVDQFMLSSEDIQITILKSAVAAGIAAVFKLLRDVLGSDSKVNNIPL